MAYEYEVPRAHGSDDLLIEFHDESSNKEFASALMSVLAGFGAHVTETKRTITDGTFCIMDCPAGKFDVWSNDWGHVSIHTDLGNGVIDQIDAALTKSGRFRRVSPRVRTEQPHFSKEAADTAAASALDAKRWGRIARNAQALLIGGLALFTSVFAVLALLDVLRPLHGPLVGQAPHLAFLGVLALIVAWVWTRG